MIAGKVNIVLHYYTDPHIRQCNRSRVYCVEITIMLDMLFYLVSLLAISKAFEVNEIHVPNTDRYDVVESEDASCARQMLHVYNDDVITPYPPVLTGEWTSSVCEVRSGPNFLLRKYRFHDDNEFSLYQFYYEDSSCRHPMYTVLARGSYNIFQPSWILTGATEMDYQLNHVTVMATSDKMADRLSRKVNTACPNYTRGQWEANQWYDVFTYQEEEDSGSEDDAYPIQDTDCLKAFSLSLHELQLVRLELRKRHHDQGLKQLLLGDIHTDPRERKTYRPTAFQQPLTFINTANCPVCAAISASDEYRPAVLHHQHVQPLELVGSWFSTVCETRPNGVFITRHLSFHQDGRTWDGYYHHFLDGRCQQPQFTVYVSGKYVHVTSSRKVHGAHDVDFQALKASITPTDMYATRLLNTYMKGYKRCGAEPWQLNHQQDITVTKGCDVLAIHLPHIEYELVRLDRHHHKQMLYLGQRATSGVGEQTPSSRPTAFQAGLVRCSDSTNAVTPAYSFHQLPTDVRHTSGAEQMVRHSIFLLTGITLMVYSL